MRAFVITAITASLMSLPALATDSGTAAGATTGAVGGAIVGGPVGAAVGAGVGAAAGSAASGPNRNETVVEQRGVGCSSTSVKKTNEAGSSVEKKETTC
jgi:hypothetical protein